MDKKIVIGLVTLGCIAGFIIVPAIIRARNTAALNACVNNLRLIDSATRGLSLERGFTNKAPTWEEITPYIGHGPGESRPICPKGGTYALGTLHAPPKCSVGGLHHLPP